MADIYVSGPVLRHGVPVPEWVGNTYETVLGSARELGLNVSYPEAEPYLERADPRIFLESIRQRISASQVAVVIFTGGDVSSGIEATMASNLNKPQVVISDDPATVPRLLRGLPTVTGVIRPDYSLVGQLDAFLRRNLRGPAQAR